MALKQDSDSGSYISFCSTEHQPWSPKQSTKSTSSSEIDTDEKKYRKVEINVNTSETSVGKTDLLRYFDDIIFHMTDGISIHPEIVRYSQTDLQREIIKLVKSLELSGNVFVYFANCLPVTVNTKHSYSSHVRSHLLCDVCVFSEQMSPLVLSFMKTKEPKMAGYSIELGQLMNGILRKSVYGVSVASGTVEMDKVDFPSQVKEILKDSSKFAVSQYSRNKLTFRDLVKTFLKSVALSCIASERDERYLSKSQFEFIISSTEGPWKERVEIDVNSSIPFLMAEMAVRLSKRGRTLLEVPHGDGAVIKRLSQFELPMLDVVTRATKKETSARYTQVLTTADDSVYSTNDTDIWIFFTGTQEADVEHSTVRALPVPSVHTLPRSRRKKDEIKKEGRDGSPTKEWIRKHFATLQNIDLRLKMKPVPAQGFVGHGLRKCKSAESVLRSCKSTESIP